ncbi:MAG: hypothetical protein ABR567_21220 [Myxococcales bacterium]|nr:hypothetical protein [Myxococcales bacterium]
MATYDRNYGAISGNSAADSRLARPLRLDWSALVGGSLMGWGILLLLSMIGMAIGLSVIDPFAVRPAASNAGAAIWGGASAIVASFVGAFLVIRLAGDRRRSESLAHGGVAWGMSMLLAGLIALFASGAAAFSRTPAGNTATHRSTRGQTVSLVETTGNGGVVAIFATAGALLALCGSLLGALAAASRESGVPLANEFRIGHRSANGHHKDTTIITPDASRDETTILPPTH